MSKLTCAIVLVAAITRMAAAQCLEWTQLSTPNRPESWQVELAYDKARHRAVALQGSHSTLTDRVVVYHLGSQGWSLVNTVGSVPLGPRAQFGVCYHPVRQTVLLFGGYTGIGGGATAANDFWEWDGSMWRQIQHPGPWPPATGANFMVYDSSRQRIILLCDDPNSSGLWDTWEWTGAAWEAGHTLGPIFGPQFGVSFCFDEFRRVGFVYCLDTAGDWQNVWEYTTGATAAQCAWNQVVISGPVYQGYEVVSLVYDPYRRKIIRQDGRASNSLYSFSPGTYSWDPDLRKWDLVAFMPDAQRRGASASCFDSDLDRVLLYGGARQDPGTPPSFISFTDTWSFTDDAPGIVVDVASTASWCPGQNGVLSVSVAGSATVQWYKNDQPILGATSTILVVNPVSAASAGVYDCLVSNNCGAIWSRRCTASVTIPPAITSQPVGDSGCPGQNINIVGPTASGTNPEIFLQRYNGFVWVDVPYQYNPTGNFYVLPNAQNSQSGEYRFEARNSCGTAQSNQFHVQVGVTISQQTPSQAVQPCQNVSFSVTAQGVGALSYIWRRNAVPLVDNGHITGAQTSTLSINGMRYADEGVYTCVVSDSCESQITGGAHLFMQSPPQWTHRTNSGPLRRPATDMVYDKARGVCVLYGGLCPITFSSVPNDETWEWDGVEWTRRFPAHNPGGRQRHELVYDSVRNKVLLFGGWPNGTNGASDVWEYDGNDWTMLLGTTPNGPQAVNSVGGDAVFDPVRGRMIVLTNNPASGPSLNTTWEFDPVARTWQQTFQGTGAYWYDSPLAYDAALNMVLGTSYYWYNGSNPHTWRYTGTGWTEILNSQMPDRQDAFLTFDTFRQKVIMFSCCRNSPNTSYGFFHNDTYIFDGATWSPHLPEMNPALADRIQPADMAFDSRRNAMVAVGNSWNTNVGNNPIDTWEYRYLDGIVFDRQPQNQPLTIGATTQFRVAAAGAGTLLYQWRKNGVPVPDGPTGSGSTISGAQTPTLVISNTTGSDTGSYTCLVTNACGSLLSSAASLGTACYPNCDNSTVAPTLNANDFQCFLNKYAANDPYCNCDGSTAAPVLNANDFQCFLNSFAAGCT